MDTFVAPVLLFVIFSGVVYYVFAPFLGPQVLAIGDEAETASLALKMRKISLYEQLREAEFEKQMGLVAENDYVRIRSDLMDEVAGVISASEMAAPGGTAEVVATGEDDACHNCGAMVESDARFCEQCGDQLGGRCPVCGAKVQLQDHFCGQCGRGLINSS